MSGGSRFLLVVLIFLPLFGFGQDSLRLLTWNIQMLPVIVHPNGKAKRARAIVEQLEKNPYDVVVFQELFKKRSRRIISKGLAASYPYHTRVLNKRSIGLKTNGGVMIFSRHPIKETHQIRYSKRTGFDKLSRKGALMAEIDFHGKPVQVIGTHLQAFGDVEIMHSQYDQLYDELLGPYTKPGVAQLICGDLNTLKTVPTELPANVTQRMIDRLPRYQRMLQTLEAQDGELEGTQQYTMDRPYNDLCKSRKEFRLLLDYVLVRTTEECPLNISRRVRIMRQAWHKNHLDLSDHFGLEAVISGF
ncbi:MAG: sphingomyelin phosphodiesterase [Cytophagales bacterium]|nr:sphingomyelin phosphodiesterase [Cytophagales bacterium]